MAHDAIEALNRVGLTDFIQSLPKGLETHVLSGGKGLNKQWSCTNLYWRGAWQKNQNCWC